METNALLIDAITTILTAFITFGLVALLPYLQARSKQKVEQAAIAAETDIKKSTSGTEALEKMTGSFGHIQDFYEEALNVSNTKLAEVRTELTLAHKRSQKLTKMIYILKKQIRLLGQEPEVTLDDVLQVMKGGDPNGH
jgi:predicted glycosyltransferase